MSKLNLPADKFEKRNKDFSAVVADIRIEEMFFGGQQLVLDFGEEAPLNIKLNYDRWTVDAEGNKVPKAGSIVWKFFKSLADLGIEVDIDVEAQTIVTTPSLIGMKCDFCCQEKSFNNGKEDIVFRVWTVTKISKSKKTC